MSIYAEDRPANERLKPYPAATDAARALNVLGDKWALRIIEELRAGPVRFRVLQVRLQCSSETLRTRLNAMVADQLLTRTRYREVPPRVDYELTHKGVMALSVVEALGRWAREWLR